MDTNPERRNDFLNDPKTIHIVTVNTHGEKINAEFVNRISNDSKPIFSWSAWNSNATAMRADQNDVRGLRNFIGVCEGAPIILLTNLDTKAGLANGSRGIVHDVVFDDDSHKDDVPLFVVCEFPDYTGPVFPPFADDPEKRKWIPVPTSTFSVRNRKTGSRTQIPISVAKALTTWKAQGMSLPKIYVHIDTKRNKNGLVYTGVSRTTSPGGLLTTAFESDLLHRIPKSKGMERLLAEMARLSDLAEENVVLPTPQTRVTSSNVSDAMDIRNYSADILGSEVADHTLAQDCAWRKRMRKHNSRIVTLETILSATPAPLGRCTSKKRKRSTAKSATKRARAKTNSKKTLAKRPRTAKHS